MESGQSVVTLSLLASLAIFGALFGPTKFGDGGEVVTTTVTGPVITEHKHVEKRPNVVKTTTQEFIKRELDWLAKEKEQLSLLRNYISGAKIKRDEKARRTRDISNDLLELEKRQMALLSSIITTNKYLQYAVAFLSVVAVYAIIRNKGREQDEKIASPPVTDVKPEPKQVDDQEDVVLRRRTNVSAPKDLDLDILQVSNQEPQEQEEVLKRNTVQQQHKQELVIPTETEKNGEVYNDVIIRDVVEEPSTTAVSAESDNADKEPSTVVVETVPETEPAPVVDKPIIPRRVVHGVASLRGIREENEDAHVAITSLPKDPTSSYFAVFDGHGGKQASSYCAKKVHINMTERKCYATDKRKALIKGFLITDHDYLLKTPEDGCTALAALLTSDNTLYVANAGDSRGVLCKNGEVIAMTEDHKPNNETEILRINAAGCEVTAEDVHMHNDTVVTIYRVNDMLAVSRAIGDSEFKDITLEPEEQAVTAYPDVYEYQLEIACDGVWDVMSNEEVIELIRVQYSMYKNLSYVAKVVAQEALEKGSTDNVTVVIVGLENA